MNGRIASEARSALMSRIKSKDTKPELAVRRFLHRRGFRYSLHRRDLPGTPDIVLPRYDTVVFVHGCLWHGHIPCAKYLPPRTRRDYWIPKIRENRRRDARQARALRRLGWRAIAIWECQIDGGLLLETRLRPLIARRSGHRTPFDVRLTQTAAMASFQVRSLLKRMQRIIRRVMQAHRERGEAGRERAIEPTRGIKPL